MGANAPKQPVLPQAYTAKSLQLEGHSIEIRGTDGILAHRPYLWIPSLKMIAGDIAVFQQMHVWTADTQSVAERQAWQAQLNEMLALKPEMVVPGHMRQGEKRYIRDSVHRGISKRFEQEAGKAKDGNALISAMQAAYPDAVGAISLEIGARVAKGEMKWYRIAAG
jgi:glyoxylase-like metal-dependent hydrolase (beta-lactamase superfamily II)